jgi:hypothetical protein
MVNIFMKNIKLIFFAVILSFLLISILYSLPNHIWDTWLPATCMSSSCFCEEIVNDNSVKQPINSWTSLAFVVTALYIFSTSSNLETGQKRLPVLYAFMLGIASLITGLGSAFYHASLTFTGQLFDILGMFLLATIMLVYAWERLFKLSRVRSLIIFALINIGLLVIQIVMPETRRFVFAMVFVLALIFEYLYLFTKKPKIDSLNLHLGLGLFVIAYAIWILDNFRLICEPTSLLQGHGVWHILGAIAVGLLYRYYSSETLTA